MLVVWCRQAVQERRPEGGSWCLLRSLFSSSAPSVCCGFSRMPVRWSDSPLPWSRGESIKNVSVLLTDPSRTPDTKGNQVPPVGLSMLSLTWLCLAPVLSTARPPRLIPVFRAVISLTHSSSQIFTFFPLTPSPSSSQPRGSNDLALGTPLGASPVPLEACRAPLLLVRIGLNV